jgi:hypothetical protein
MILVEDLRLVLVLAVQEEVEVQVIQINAILAAAVVALVDLVLVVDVNMLDLVVPEDKMRGETDLINIMLQVVEEDTLVLTAVDLVNILLLLVDLVGLVLVVMVLFAHMEQLREQQTLDQVQVLADQELEILGL